MSRDENIGAEKEIPRWRERKEKICLLVFYFDREEKEDYIFIFVQ